MWQIAIKDLKIFFTDKKALMLALLLPIGLITLFAFAFGGVADDDEEPDPISVLYNDEDNSEISKYFLAGVDSIPGLELIKTTTESAQQSIREGDELAAIIIRDGFDDAVRTGVDFPVELIFDESRAMETGILQSILIGRLSELNSAQQKSAGIRTVIDFMMPHLTETERDSLFQNVIRLETDKKQNELLTATSIVGEEAKSWGLIQAVAGTAIMMLLFSVSSLGQSILEEKESGVLKKLLQSPIHPLSIMYGKMATATIVSVFQLTVMFVFAWLAFGLDIFINIPALVVMIIATAFACSAFGVFLSSVVTTKKQADSLGTIIILFMSGLGGSMIPLYIMPQFMENIAVFTVNYWAIQGFYDIFWRNSGFDSIIQNATVLLAITIGVLLISGILFRKNVLRIA